MKTYQSTGYFQQALIILLLCLVTSFVFAGSALALTGNNINSCYDCHGSTADLGATGDIRPLDSSNGFRNITTGAVKGSHRTHLSDMPATTVAAPATSSANACTLCHGSTPITNLSHRDGLIEMNTGLQYAGKPQFFNQTSVPILGSCSNASCHASPYGSTLVVTPVWGTVSGCAACHKDAGAFDATYGAPTTGAHNMHLVDGIACNSCHINVAKNSNTSAVHINGSIDVTGYAAPIAKHATTGGYGSCTTAACHGTSSPVWNATTANSLCTKCHGTATTAAITADNRYLVAPPRNLAGATGTLTGTGLVSNDPKVGAHQAHIQFLNGFSNYSTQDFRCANCHGTLPTLGTHASTGSSIPAFQGLATRNGKTAATWNAATMSCSNTYCHNPAGATNGLNAANAGLRTFVSWTASSYVTNSTKTQTNCNRCHKSPGDAGFTSTTDHSTMTITTDCSGCHGHNGNTQGIAGQRHMDGVLYGGGNCDSCHGYQPGSWAAKAELSAVPEGKGAHEVHIAYLIKRYSVPTLDPTADPFGGTGTKWVNVCGVCHYGSTHNTGEARPGTGRTIAFPPNTYNFGAAAPVYNARLSIGVSSAVTPKTCSNLSCHYFTTPLWSTY